jgi:hypothetical protein
LDIYRITRKFPKEERYGLTSQNIGYGSNCELETQVLLSGDLGYVEAGKLAELIDKIAEVERMLKALIKSLEKNHLAP